jgi:hypothetical protein
MNIAPSRQLNYTEPMFNLTKQQQMFLCVVLFLLLTGWAVKAWRAAHPGTPTGAAIAP